jgi:hypothetical protein
MAFTKKQPTHTEKYNLSNPEHKRQIIEFEKEFGKKNFMEILKIKGYFKFNDYYSDGYLDDAFIEQINDLQEKYYALAKLEKRRKYMQKQESLINYAENELGYARV